MRQTPGGAQGVGNGQSCLPAFLGKILLHLLEEIFFAMKAAGAAGDVQEQALRLESPRSTTRLSASRLSASRRQPGAHLTVAGCAGPPAERVVDIQADQRSVTLGPGRQGLQGFQVLERVFL